MLGRLLKDDPNGRFVKGLVLSDNLIVEESAFADNTYLTSVEYSAASNATAASAFKGCVNLASVILPANIDTIGVSTFYGCSKLTSITLPTALESIGETAFAHSGLTSITLPDGLLNIGISAFSGSSGLREVTVEAEYNDAPELELNVFAATHNKLKILVPNGETGYATDTAKGWGLYKDYIEALSA
jgi:hypothetical protein